MACEGAGALQCKRTRDNAEILEKGSLSRSDQLIAPVERCTQRLVTEWRRAAPAPCKAQAPPDKFIDFDQAVRREPARHQLDRQRHPIELATDPANDLGVSVGDTSAITGRYGALHEEARG